MSEEELKKEIKKQKLYAQGLENIIKLTYKAMMWAFIFLTVGTISRHYAWKWVGVSTDIGIIIGTLYLIRFVRAIKKKEKSKLEEKKEKNKVEQNESN